MLTRRRLMRDFGLFAVATQVASEPLLARRLRSQALAPEVQQAAAPHEIVWLDSNENPAGPSPSAIKAMADAAAAAARYHFDEFPAFTNAIAHSENVKPEQVLFGVGSTEVIDAAICAFTSESRPLISASSTYDIVIDLARSLGKKVAQVPLTDAWAYDVRKLAEEATKAGGGLIYVCNPNNPTSSITPARDIDWLAANLPPNTVLLMDEAYIHFAQPGEIESAMKHVRENRNVIVTRTFSKIYGMAGARAGFGCAPAELVKALNPFMDKVIPVMALRGAMAALAEQDTLVPRRRAELGRIRSEFCDWLRGKDIPYIEPHANFVMVDIKRDVKTFGKQMLGAGVAVGRPFPPLDGMLRVTMGTDADMRKFRDVFSKVYASEPLAAAAAS
ncbi:MAG TPA: aminotransferase class I/II-fold pyridoxal phosphate-dependent enzyme [Candidatus Limnocylindrales bacterium]|jgi:histidinol-phosphate aminotransferase|nr:aminotransferase class I/II-fold pyridoxal phosphate-dependent enzyme [Candidatus Limnocylindrales bacterium]